MSVVRIGKNILFALAILLIVGSIDEANLPYTQRIEEYIAFVLTTDFEYETYAERLSQWDPWGDWDFEWRRWVPWRGEPATADLPNDPLGTSLEDR